MRVRPELRRRGYLLPLTVLGVSALFVFGVIFLQFVRAQARSSRHVLELAEARQAAEAGRTEVLARLRRDGQWRARADWTPMPASNAAWRATFDSKDGLPYCTVNSGTSTATGGWGGRRVPPGYIHVVAVGRCGSTLHRAEALAADRGALVVDERFDQGVGAWESLRGRRLTAASGRLVLGGMGAPGVEPNVVACLRSGVVDFEVELEVSPSGAGWSGFFFRGHLADGDLRDGLRLRLDPSSGQVRLEALSRGQVSLLSSATVAGLGAAPVGGTHPRRFKVGAEGDRIKVSLDGRELLSGRDPLPASPDGRFGFETHDQGALEIRRVKATTLGLTVVSAWTAAEAGDKQGGS